MPHKLFVTFVVKDIPLDEDGLPKYYHTQMECLRYALDKIMYSLLKAKNGDELASIPNSIISFDGSNFHSVLSNHDKGTIDATRIDEEIQRKK